MPDITLVTKHRSTGGQPGAPASLATGEMAYNMADGKFYMGYGDNGSGMATSIKVLAQDNFAYNLPANGSNGKILSFVAGVPSWQDAPEGALYTAGNGITLTGSEFTINDAVVVTHVDLDAALATLATDGEVATLLAGKSNVGHTHAASDVTSGTFDAARIPTLDAAKIGTGTIDPARLPANVFQAPIVASSNIASLTAPQQAEIAPGSPVVTSDGRFWLYVGGSKTAEASYREMADKTPDYSQVANTPVLALVATSGAYADLSGRPTLSLVATSNSYLDLSNRPSFAVVATSGSYNDLSNRPTLGTMAAQNAAAVAITGGTITGVTLHGGTF